MFHIYVQVLQKCMKYLWRRQGQESPAATDEKRIM